MPRKKKEDAVVEEVLETVESAETLEETTAPDENAEAVEEKP